MDNKCVGITAEYNPFHNGHLYHLEQSKLATGAQISIAAMSGNFVQRGEAAVLDKWSRTRLALQNGAALVLELPLPWAVAGAEKICTRRHFVIKCARLRRYTDVWQRNRRYRSPHALRGILALRCV